jgi:hypothetical protein
MNDRDMRIRVLKADGAGGVEGDSSPDEVEAFFAELFR